MHTAFNDTYCVNIVLYYLAYIPELLPILLIQIWGSMHLSFTKSMDIIVKLFGGDQ